VASSSWLARERSTRLVLALTLFVFYAWFFQGGGWNQNARFDTVRALVEQGTAEITDYAGNTGDVSFQGDQVFSNKAPGMSLLGAPIYALLYGGETLLGIDPAGPYSVNANAHVVSFFTSGLPALLLVLLLFSHFRGTGVRAKDALLLCLAFGCGTLFLPYAGTMMSHSLIAYLLFAGWYCLSRDELEPRQIVLAGVALGVAAVSEYLVIPLLVPYAFVVWLRTRDLKLTSFFLVGLLVAVVVYFAYTWFAYGAFFRATYAAQDPMFQDEGLLFGMIGLPQPIRLYWLSFHPFRGLFYTCPVLILGLLGLPHWRDVTKSGVRALLPVCVIGHFVLFNLCFNGWTGGWGVGPRYLIPIIPFVFLLAPIGLSRFPRLSMSLGALSVLLMLISTSVLVFVPAPNQELRPASPVTQMVPFLVDGRVSISTQSMLEWAPSMGYAELWDRNRRGIESPTETWDSYNLGEVLGLQGLWSLLPLLLLLLPVTAHLRRLARLSPPRATSERGQTHPGPSSP
jgi:hypothetical protein